MGIISPALTSSTGKLGQLTFKIGIPSVYYCVSLCICRIQDSKWHLTTVYINGSLKTAAVKDNNVDGEKSHQMGGQGEKRKAEAAFLYLLFQPNCLLFCAPPSLPVRNAISKALEF